MRADITVPNFDDSAGEVVISSWYKKVGDLIAKNEVIADAETPSVACAITSGYDCILVDIIAKEGDTVPQGAKIAVIETDPKADISDVLRKIEKKDARAESELVAKIQEEREIAESGQDGYVLSLPHEEIVEEMVEEFSEKTEENCKHLLKNTENLAKAEALKLKEEILEEARNTALIKAEEVKMNIFREYEGKAARDAAEMHNKIVEGSIREAERTKEKLIEEAKEKAEREAEELRSIILENAKKTAQNDADLMIRETVAEAKNEAKKRAEQLSREIIETAIIESKAEAKAIKKDIIHSARKYAAKESSEIVKEVVKEARTRSRIQAEELVESTTRMAMEEANLLKEEILKSVSEEMKVTIGTALSSAIQNIKDEIRVKISENSAIREEIARIKGESAVSAAVQDIKNEIREKIGKNCEIRRELSKIKEKCDLEREIAREKICESEEQSEIVKKLLHADGQNQLPPEVYADNWNKPKFFESPGDYNEPIDMLKRRISEKMRDSYDSSVISTVSNEVDMSAVLALEKTFGGAFSRKHSTRLGFTPFFISASIAALKQYRVFNAHIYNDEIIYKNNFDISVITCGNDGIAAPVIRHAETLSIAEIEKAMIYLSRRAMEGTLSVEEASGGTFTVINAGIYGSLIGTDLLTPPQVATLSVHKMHNRPVATENGTEVKPMLYISLSYDHRISDTRKASEFLSNIKDYVENPGWQVLGLN
ncbi:MAG: 2-oxo acid dehydrogenase subunit E2 [Holosporaceae bacterium]|jgi:2-oxoglutarate dehydrogenase E2 component (dihydrolipoamide succinyltransferase)|nr:2-oxo acid dehydrogenase subunit E2 [Holosporaceae bacterium]